ncbi:F-box/WD repeat-containing protein pof10-like [Asparagus officinalis]|uniref:F-box/WD repeat-containing protein pof10-like n=1 Tax=Asparagus officinalis TaxID=4686 RepID=UPI00098E17EE|nr:F-box/WD repeat-containing protein pof10-like [Asparagus officinalis]
MERLPSEVCLKVFHLLDHQALASSLQVSKKWKVLASEDVLWCNLFKERWGEDQASFFAPNDLNSWKDVYIVQDRCDRHGLGLKIIREGCEYYLIHQGEIQRYLGSGSKPRKDNKREQEPSQIAESILFFIGDLETACAGAKRVRM